MLFKRLNSLFFKAVVVLIVISIVPVIIIGFHVLGVDSRILKNEILQKQQTVARRIISAANSALTYQEQMLSVFVDLNSNVVANNESFSPEDLIFFQSLLFYNRKNIDIEKSFYPALSYWPDRYEVLLPSLFSRILFQYSL